MSDQDAETGEASGHVKWFDPGKGFGFILNDAGGPDILLHANVLRNFGQSSIAEGAHLRVRAIRTGRGLQAVQVLAIGAPTGEAQVAPGADEAGLEALPFRPARVKWFDRAKGFGFANVFGAAGDVFLHSDVLRQGGYADLAVGEAIALRITEGPRGMMAAQIAGWDRGLTAAGAASVAAAQPRPTAPLLSPVGAEALAQPPQLVADRPE